MHSIKGQTHTATLYLESSYQRDPSYESQRLSPQFKGTALTSTAGIRVKESAKMAYVGLSRPTHLLCFAVHKDRFEESLADIDPSKWKIVKLFDERSSH